MDTYQPIFDAVRSRLSNGDIGHAIERAVNDAGIGFHAGQTAESIRICGADVADAMRRPSVLFRPEISFDGKKWCALYGQNLQDGVAGFGDTPAEAMAQFDAAWTKP